MFSIIFNKAIPNFGTTKLTESKVPSFLRKMKLKLLIQKYNHSYLAKINGTAKIT